MASSVPPTAAQPTNPLIHYILFCLQNRQAHRKAYLTASFPPITRREIICNGIECYLGLPILGTARTVAEAFHEHQVKQFSGWVARGSIPGRRRVSRILPYAKTKDLEPETFIQWIKAALEYKYPL